MCQPNTILCVLTLFFHPETALIPPLHGGQIKCPLSSGAQCQPGWSRTNIQMENLQNCQKLFHKIVGLFCFLTFCFCNLGNGEILRKTCCLFSVYLFLGNNEVRSMIFSLDSRPQALIPIPCVSAWTTRKTL